MLFYFVDVEGRLLQLSSKAFHLSSLFILFIYLSNVCTWLLDHLAPSLPVPTDNAVSRVFIESSILKQVVTIHLGMAMAAELAGLVSSQAKPVEVYSQEVMSSV
ncbi:uncharacterized protein TNCV_4442731 [Trichonephila clavipes]|nr:uncharacterized protein TNCV_4442731 [Trichonephila clavipes]